MSLLLVLALADVDVCEVRIYLRQSGGEPAPLRGVTAAVVVPGRPGLPGASIPSVIEVPLREEAVPGEALPPQSRPVPGTTLRAEVVVFRRPLEGAAENPPPPGACVRPDPYFRAVFDPQLLDPEGSFWIVFLIHGRQRIVKGFSCHDAAARARLLREEIRRSARALRHALEGKDLEASRAAAERLRLGLERLPATAPCRDACLRAMRELRPRLEAGAWDAAKAALRACAESCGEREEREAPAPPDARRRP